MQPVGNLSGKRVLVVEDEWFIASDIARELEAAGARVIGPAMTAQAALRTIKTERPDGAIVDIDLQGAKSFDVADHLDALGIPFVFATGYDQSIVPSRHRHVTRIEKPAKPDTIIAALGASLES